MRQIPRPETGDIVIDAALADFEQADDSDLDGVIAAAERVHETLRGRLADLHG